MSVQSISGKKLVPMILEQLESGNEFPLIVTGHSMSPTLYHERDRVYLVSPKIRKPANYEIVFFARENGTYVLHRIIKVQTDGQFLINGDAQTWTEVIKFNQVLAVVERIERKGRIINCDNFWYRVYVHLWIGIKPVRGIFMRFCNRIRKLWK